MNKLGFHLIGKPNEDFESCSDCIHAEDSEEICILRKCVHAIKYLYDCYEKVGHKTGKWEWVQHDSNPELGNWNCSECGFIPASFNLAKKHLNYCPNCGARMVGEEE